MLELYPTRVLTNEQMEHIVECWQRKALVQSCKRDRRTWVYVMKAAFFQQCIPRLLHDVVFQHFADANWSKTVTAHRFVYAVVSTLPSAGEGAGPWRPCHGPRYLVPLTGNLGWRFRDHPEVVGVKRGRLVAIHGQEMYREAEHIDKLPRLLLSISPRS